MVLSLNIIATYLVRHTDIGIYIPLYIRRLPVVLIEDNMQNSNFKKLYVLKYILNVLDFDGSTHIKTIIVSPSHYLYQSQTV
jgi:hypothetical protein